MKRCNAIMSSKAPNRPGRVPTIVVAEEVHIYQCSPRPYHFISPPICIKVAGFHKMEKDLTNWKGCPLPERKIFEGRYVRLEPLDPARHGDDLYIAHSGEGADLRLKYLWEVEESRENFEKWMNSVKDLDHTLFFAVIDKQTGKVGGRQSFLRIDATNGVVEIGHIMWGPLIARKRAATEALYLFARYVFEELGYRRFEWKCHDGNGPSKRAAVRFGFDLEGIFRHHMVMKGENRDTAWFAMIDKDWPVLKEAFEKWLNPANFDEQGVQKTRLEDFRK